MSELEHARSVIRATLLTMRGRADRAERNDRVALHLAESLRQGLDRVLADGQKVPSWTRSKRS